MGFSLEAPHAVADPWASPDGCYADSKRCATRSGVNDKVVLIPSGSTRGEVAED